MERKVNALKWPKSKSLTINYMHRKNDLLFINSPHQTWSISSFVKVNSYVLHHLSRPKKSTAGVRERNTNVSNYYLFFICRKVKCLHFSLWHHRALCIDVEKNPIYFIAHIWAPERAIYIIFHFFFRLHCVNLTIPHFKINSQANAYSQVHLMGEDGGGRWCAVKLFVATGCHFSHGIFGNGSSVCLCTHHLWPLPFSSCIKKKKKRIVCT